MSRTLSVQSLRGQTQNTIQFLFGEDASTLVILASDYEDELYESLQFTFGHLTNEFFRKQFASIYHCLHLLCFESDERLERNENISHLFKAIDPELGHPVVSTRNITDLQSFAYPVEGLFMPSILIEADGCHEPYATFCVGARFHLQHQTTIAIKKPCDVCRIGFKSTSHGIIVSLSGPQASPLPTDLCTSSSRNGSELDSTVISHIVIRDLSLK